MLTRLAAGICLRADRREHLGKIAVLHVQHDDTDVVRLSLSQSGGKEIRPVAVFLLPPEGSSPLSPA